jgi:hypothetical protein
MNTVEYKSLKTSKPNSRPLHNCLKSSQKLILFQQMRPSSSIESAFRTHLSSAMGYYCHLLFKLQSEFQLHIETMVDFYCVADPKSCKLPFLWMAFSLSVC